MAQDEQRIRSYAAGNGTAFSASEYAARITAVCAAMQERGLDALLVSTPENIFYLTGLNHQGHFTFTALVLTAEGTSSIVARAMERETLAAQVPDCEHVAFEDHEEPAAGVVRALRGVGIEGGRIGVEKQTMSLPVQVYEGSAEKMPRVDWIDGTGIVDDLRTVKSPAEIDCVRRASAISDYALQTGIEVAGPGVNEQDVAAEIHRTMYASGSEHPGFVPLIRTRDLLSCEHTTWHDRTLRAGEGLFMELSGCVHRYHAPVTRMVHIGEAPEGVDAASEIASAGLEAICDALRPGALTRDVYAAWQTVIDEALGHHDYRRHHCGYMVGIGFPPSWVGGGMVKGIRPDGETIVREGMVFHILPWLIGQGPADHLFSDTVLVTGTGAEILTKTDRAPTVV